jgi:hypothetical protein
MTDITLRNITTYDNVLPAGIIRCNSTNPCKNFIFEDVNVHSKVWDVLGYGYITEFVEGQATNSHPDPGFKPVGYFDDPENVKDAALEDQIHLSNEYLMMMVAGALR